MDMIGKQIGSYRIEEKLGEGGMGVVYKATDLDLDRPVAIKVLSADLSQDPALLERFRAEAKAQAHLSHANIASLYNLLNIDGHTAIVMEYLEGETFDQILRRRGLVPWEQAVPWFRQALLGIGFAHRMGIIHRDIKPSNIMVNRHGIVKVMDFGIAKVIGGQRLTKTGMQVGTVAYMSPEQVKNQPVDIRTDIYCLGVTLYELLTAHLPFESDSDFQVMSDHVNTPPPPPTRHYPYIPSGIQECVLKALEKDPDARFQSAEEFGAALEHPEGTAAAAQAGVQAAAPDALPTLPATPTPTPPTPHFQPEAMNSAPAAASVAAAAAPTGSKGTTILFAGVAVVLIVMATFVYGATVVGRRFFRSKIPVVATAANSRGELGDNSTRAKPSELRDSVTPATAQKPAPREQGNQAAEDTGNTPNVLSALAQATKSDAENKAPADRPVKSSGPAAPRQTIAARPATAHDSLPQQQESQAQPPAAEQNAPPPASASELEAASETLVKLHGRIDAANQSLTGMKQQMAAQGLGLRGDIVAAESRMYSYFQMADRALQNRDVASAQKNIERTEEELTKIEHFLGR